MIFKASLVFLITSAVAAAAHTVHVINKCGGPTTVQIPGHPIYGAGKHTFKGDVRGGIAQASKDINGQGATSVEFSLVNGVSSADITLIPPHRFNHPARFTLDDGHGNSVGATCRNSHCGPHNAFYKFDDYTAQRQVTGPDSNIKIQFC
ncbi:hypothetical protein FA10DRAFT_295708 [Acaromyces ingoldii]|uniref:Uncharacterized protein n=1 Tax=Acaromyces ingoldii TaxID=215250 RepID=A0A316YJ71_9BASI|nr:hypothetical protein FA10DRAFT_295708 [Acaromyces ingoldii]PWN88143.1 hypothetical protein FA10DRAFT_295708 [Acaromyces ingoldii]